MRTRAKPPESDKEFYKKRFSHYGRKTFEVAASALFFFFVDWVIHTLLTALHIPSATQPGEGVYTTVHWAVCLTYLIYMFRLLLPDASEQVAEIHKHIVQQWKKTKTRGKK